MKSFTIVWDTYWIGWRCRACSYVERFSRHNCCIVSFWAVRWIPDDVIKIFVIWQLDKKVTQHINLNFTEVFWVLHFTSLKITVHYLFVWNVCVLIRHYSKTCVHRNRCHSFHSSCNSNSCMCLYERCKSKNRVFIHTGIS